jgi:hypothetical protein
MSGYSPYYPVSHDRYRFINPANPYGLKSVGEQKPNDAPQYAPSEALRKLAEEIQANLVLLATLEEGLALRIEQSLQDAKRNNQNLVDVLGALKL